MIAAAARMSGTSAPVSSILKRGTCASWICLASAAALARASLARRARAVEVEYFFAFLVLVTFFLLDDAVLVDFALAASNGKPNATIVVSRQISRNARKSRNWVTGKPLNLIVLQEVSAL